jgi:hypothetical protein
MKGSRSIVLWIGFILLGVVQGVPAQVNTSSREAAGVIAYADGMGFQVVNADRPREYDLRVDAVEGMELFPGDFVNTYEGTFLEIRLDGGMHSIKISENTSFRFSPSPGEKERQFEVNFGRVRARVGKLAGLEKFAIQSPSGVAGVRGTDFGYDFLLVDPAAAPVASIYCFEGEIEVKPSVPISASRGLEKDIEEQLKIEAAPSLILSAGEMFVLKEAVLAEGETEGEGFVLEKSSVAGEILEFWEVNDFQDEKKGETPVQTESLVEQRAEPVPGIRTESKFLRASALTAGLGTAFGAAAAGFYYADPLFEGMNPDVRENLVLSMGVAAGIFLGTSLFTLLAGVF